MPQTLMRKCGFMKGNRIVLVLLAAVGVVTSCKSIGITAKEAEAGYATSIADIDAISLGTTTFYAKSFGKLKQKTVSKFFVAPRRNTVELHLHDGVNFIKVVMKQGAREQVIKATQQFVYEWDEHTLQNVKANAKNAYVKGCMDFSFGVVSAVHELEGIPFYMNCIFMDGQPYLVMRIPSQKVKNEDGVYSPYTEIYFSRSQAESLAERLSQEYLEKLVQDNTFVEQQLYEQAE
jgi:hypothetical protein